jgi:hypothetical protein
LIQYENAEPGLDRSGKRALYADHPQRIRATDDGAIGWTCYQANNQALR